MPGVVETLCQHVETSPGMWVCPTCKHPAKTSHPPKRVCGPWKNAKPKPKSAPTARQSNTTLAVQLADVPCQYRGELLREEGCKPCQTSTGLPTVEVFTCSKHRECTLQTTAIRPRIKSCSTCPDRPRVIRVVLLSPSLERGGAERWMISFARSVQSPVQVIGCSITQAHMIDEGQRAEMETICPVTVGTQSAGVMQQADIVIAWGVDDVRKHLHESSAEVVYLAQGACAWTGAMVRENVGHVNYWAGVSEICRRVFPAEIRDMMTVLHNGSEVDRIKPVHGRAATRKAWGIPHDKKLVGYIGRICPTKRPEAIIQAVANLPDEWMGVIVGRGFDESQTLAAVNLANKIAPGRIAFAGHNPHVGDALSAIDVWINASPSEGFSLSLIEAWLAGVPCVSTPTGAIPELESKHGPLTWGVPIGATGEQMADAIQQASRDSSRVTTAQTLAMRELTSQAMGQRWTEYLTTLWISNPA